MIKRKVDVLLIAMLVTFTTAGCGNVKQEGLTIFPKAEKSWVGDPMPYYDGKKFNIFYLEDLRNGDKGFHPWSLFSTSNFYNYKNEGKVIPYSSNTSKILSSNPQSTMPLQIKNNDTLDFTMLIQDSVAVLYVNNQAVLSARMFTMAKHQWGIFAMDSDVTFKNLKLSK